MRDLILFLDDDESRAALLFKRMPIADREATIWVKTAKEAIRVIAKKKDRLKKIYLDHTLGYEYMHIDNRQSGMEVVRYIEKQDPKDFDGCEFVIHTWDLYAGEIMTERLEKKKLNVKFKPFGQ